MELTLKRTSVDLPEDILHCLSIKAAEKKTSLKKYMENLLIRDAEDMDDNETYAYLSKTRPDGHVMLNEEEKEEFENWLGIKR